MWNLIFWLSPVLPIFARRETIKMITNPIMKLFAHSPFKPLQEHLGFVLSSANEVPELMRGFFAKDKVRLENIRQSL